MGDLVGFTLAGSVDSDSSQTLLISIRTAVLHDSSAAAQHDVRNLQEFSHVTNMSPLLIRYADGF